MFCDVLCFSRLRWIKVVYKMRGSDFRDTCNMTAAGINLWNGNLEPWFVQCPVHFLLMYIHSGEAQAEHQQTSRSMVFRCAGNSLCYVLLLVSCLGFWQQNDENKLFWPKSSFLKSLYKMRWSDPHHGFEGAPAGFSESTCFGFSSFGREDGLFCREITWTIFTKNGFAQHRVLPLDVWYTWLLHRVEATKLFKQRYYWFFVFHFTIFLCVQLTFPLFLREIIERCFWRSGSWWTRTGGPRCISLEDRTSFFWQIIPIKLRLKIETCWSTIHWHHLASICTSPNTVQWDLCISLPWSTETWGRTIKCHQFFCIGGGPLHFIEAQKDSEGMQQHCSDQSTKV